MSEYIVKVEWQTPDAIYERQLEEIVRCRDCVYNAKDTDGICYRFDHEHFNQPDGFCAWGERREK